MLWLISSCPTTDILFLHVPFDPRKILGRCERYQIRMACPLSFHGELSHYLCTKLIERNARHMRSMVVFR